MERFAELYIPSGKVVSKLREKFLDTMNEEGAFCIEGETKIPTDFQIAGAILETALFYNEGKPDLEKTMQVLKSCKKGRFIKINNKCFLTYNAKAIYYLSCYGANYGKDLVDDQIKDLCSGFFSLANGDSIGVSFDKGQVFISDNKRGYRKNLLGDSIFWLARAVEIDGCKVTSLRGMLPFLTNQASGLDVSPAKVVYAASVCLNRRLTDDLSFLFMFLDNVEQLVKVKPSQYGVIALSTFVYVIDSLEIPITARHRVAELKEAAIKLLIASFPPFSSYLKKRLSKPIEDFSDFDMDTLNLFSLLGYDALISLSPITWYTNRLRECEALKKLLESAKVPESSRVEIIQDIAKCVL